LLPVSSADAGAGSSVPAAWVGPPAEPRLWRASQALPDWGATEVLAPQARLIAKPASHPYSAGLPLRGVHILDGFAWSLLGRRVDRLPIDVPVKVGVPAKGLSISARAAGVRGRVRASGQACLSRRPSEGTPGRQGLPGTRSVTPAADPGMSQTSGYGASESARICEISGQQLLSLEESVRPRCARLQPEFAQENKISASSNTNGLSP
jgi:hypothetical protein